MAVYVYEGLTDSGKIINGKIEADDKQNALKKAEEKKIYLYSLKKELNGQNTKSAFKNSFSRKSDMIILFTRQLSNLLLADIQLAEAIKVISRILKKGKFKDVVKGIYKSLEGGKDFTDALREYPNYFSEDYINMINSGEESGYLALTCQRIAENLEERRRLRSFVITSLTYPIILLIVSLMGIGLMIGYVLPKFMVIYKNYGQSLPLPTQILLNINKWFSHYGLIFIFFIIAFISIILVLYQSGRFDGLLLNMPILGNLFVKLEVTKITRSMSTLLSSGVPLLKSLQITSQIADNSLFVSSLIKAGNQVERGHKLSNSFSNSGVFPELVVYMIGVGEQTGKLEKMLSQLADNYEESTRRELEQLMKVFEPVIILIMGIGIAVIVISMLLPILGINTLIF